MANTLHLIPDPSPLFASSNSRVSPSPNIPRSFSPIPKFVRTRILRASNKRSRNGLGRSSKAVLQSACVIASKLGLLPAPVDSILREFGFSGGNGSGSGSWDGFGWGGGSDGWRRKKGTKLGVCGVLVLICGMGLWLVVGKDMVLDADVFLGGLGLVLFGLSVEGWRRGAKDWILGFCCCAFLMGLVFKRDDFRTWVRSLGSLKKYGRRKKNKGILRFS